MAVLLAQLVSPMGALTQPPIAPSWVVLPLSLLALLVVAGHWILLGRAKMPVVRKSIRTANGLVMMLAIPVLAFGFGVVRPSNGRIFAITWMVATGLLFMVLALAAADLIYTAIIGHRERQRLAIEVRAARALLASKARERAGRVGEVVSEGASGLASSGEAPNAGTDGHH